MRYHIDVKRTYESFYNMELAGFYDHLNMMDKRASLYRVMLNCKGFATKFTLVN